MNIMVHAAHVLAVGMFLWVGKIGLGIALFISVLDKIFGTEGNWA